MCTWLCGSFWKNMVCEKEIIVLFLSVYRTPCWCFFFFFWYTTEVGSRLHNVEMGICRGVGFSCLKYFVFTYSTHASITSDIPLSSYCSLYLVSPYPPLHPLLLFSVWRFEYSLTVPFSSLLFLLSVVAGRRSRDIRIFGWVARVHLQDSYPFNRERDGNRNVQAYGALFFYRQWWREPS